MALRSLSTDGFGLQKSPQFTSIHRKNQLQDASAILFFLGLGNCPTIQPSLIIMAGSGPGSSHLRNFCGKSSRCQGCGFGLGLPNHRLSNGNHGFSVHECYRLLQYIAMGVLISYDVVWCMQIKKAANYIIHLAMPCVFSIIFWFPRTWTSCSPLVLQTLLIFRGQSHGLRRSCHLALLATHDVKLLVS